MKNKLIIIFILLITLTLIGCTPDNNNPVYNVTTITIENPKCHIYDSADTIPATATISCYDGSAALNYCDKYKQKSNNLIP